MAPGRPVEDADKPAWARAAGRVQRSPAGRVRYAEERLRRLLAGPIPPPPEPLRFTPAPRTCRPLITGPNGAGRSTLLRVLAAGLTPGSASVTCCGRIGCLAQEPRPGDPAGTVPAAFARGRPGEAAVRGRTTALPRPVRPRPAHGAGRPALRRAAAAAALARRLGAPSDVLLLGEPAGPLSPARAEELETALSGYDGTLVVGHDRPLRRRRRGARPALPATDTSAATC